MKITRVGLACAMALATLSAQASNVTLYGVIDEALSVQHFSYVGDANTTNTSLKSGQNMGSRWGIKGTEDLGNGLTLGFSLESGFAVDTGRSLQNDRLFGRDARLYIEGDRFGLLSFGRMGPIVGGNGPYARFGRVMSPFSCGWGDLGGTLQVLSLGYDFIDNAIAYTTPKFNGLDASIQYSFGTDSTKYGDDGIEGKSSVDRLVSGAIRYENDTVMIAAGIESINQAQPAARTNHLDDSISYNLGGSYKTSWAKFYAYGQIFRDYAAAAKTTVFTLPSGVDGWGTMLGAEGPLWGGNLLFSVGYGDFEGSHASNLTMKTTQVALGYTYNLSKRTTLYSGVNWIKNNYSSDFEATHPHAIESEYEWLLGLTHKF